MSPAAALRRPHIHAPVDHETPKPRFALFTAQRRQSRRAVGYSALLVVGIAAIACAQLVLTIVTSESAYHVSELAAQNKELQRTAQIVREDLERIQSPQFLAASAESFGMVRNFTPGYLRLSDGAVLGSPSPASAGAGTVMGGIGNQVPNALLDGLSPRSPSNATSR